MSDEQRRDDEGDVEGHVRKPHASDEPAEADETEVEAHVQRFASVRMDSPSNI